jgi:hypothetical protein
VISICPEILITSLTQDIHNPLVLLDFKNILLFFRITKDNKPLNINLAYTLTFISIPLMSLTSINQPISVQITLLLIANTIKRIYKKSVSYIFKKNKSLYPSMPILNWVSPYATKYYQFKAIFEDKRTILSTISVYDNIFL